ncbi:TPR repeat protein [sediment metagenome]|uniref:TPR repeat protein n=1 Tax=sediment metagenome TaxID=749907 RepID=D9PIK6_9ZZZZ
MKKNIVITLIYLGSISVGTVFAQTAQDYLEAGKLAYDKMLETSKTTSLSLQNIGIDDVLTLFNKTIELDINSASAYYYRGLTYTLLVQPAKAISDFNTALKLNPLNADTYLGRGMAHERAGKFADAVADYDKAISINPRLVQAYIKRGAAYGILQKPHAMAIADFTAAIKINTYLSEPYRRRAMVYFAQKDYQNALADFNKSISIDEYPVDNRLFPFNDYYYRAQALCELGHFEEAIADYTKALGSIYARFEYKIYALRAYAYYKAKDYDAAWSDVDKYQQSGRVVARDFLDKLRHESGRDK